MPSTKHLFVQEEPVVGQTLTLSQEQTHYLTRVLRCQREDRFTCLCGDGYRYAATVVGLGKRDATLMVHDRALGPKPLPVAVHLWQALGRSYKMDWVVQKATEMGVKAVHPIVSERGCTLSERVARQKQSHWRRVSEQACAQSGRCDLLQVALPQAFDVALGTCVRSEPHWVGCLNARQSLLHTAEVALEGPSPPPACHVWVGPEGGWSPEEQALLSSHGVVGVSLGHHTLRTETAGLAAAAILTALSARTTR